MLDDFPPFPLFPLSPISYPLSLTLQYVGDEDTMLQAVFCLLTCLRNLFYLLKVFALGLFVVFFLLFFPDLSSPGSYVSITLTSCVFDVLALLTYLSFYFHVTLLQLAQCLSTFLHAPCVCACHVCSFLPPSCLSSQVIL